MYKSVVISALWSPKRHWPEVIIEPGVRYCMLTDRHDVPEPWERVPLVVSGDHARYRTMTRFRMTGGSVFDDAESSLWIDSDIRMTAKPTEIIEKLVGSHDVGTFQHPHRDCPYNEVNALLHSRAAVVDPHYAARMFRALADAQVEPGTPLSSCTVIARKNTEAAKKLSHDWQRHVETLCDWKHQASFTMATHTAGVSCNLVPWIHNGVIEHTLRDYHLSKRERMKNPQGRRAVERRKKRRRKK